MSILDLYPSFYTREVKAVPKLYPVRLRRIWWLEDEESSSVLFDMNSPDKFIWLVAKKHVKELTVILMISQMW